MRKPDFLVLLLFLFASGERIGPAHAVQPGRQAARHFSNKAMHLAQVRRVCHPPQSPCQKGYVYECDRCVKGG